ncbi:hypothetical protein BD410DRAFT_795883 [Rickenella mellea]|uniref:Uncharacterized protein n=1 Tax=Rickenella mellea TaxID=50990 RepID=A0A4Y7PLT7_9AGAM|nr:hypothetical protein BD410DRAFT_795883 [Rickenella mellea]
MKLILTGATGAAGLEILRAAIADTVTILSRRALPASIQPSPKAHVITHGDFASYPPSLLDQIRDHDACIWALGKSANGMTEADYAVLTHDFPVAAITAFKSVGMGTTEMPFRFVYVSGEGADQSGKSFMMFARVKGKTEKDLIDFAKSSNGTMKAQNIRPGYFFPSHPDDRQDLRTGFSRFIDRVIMPIVKTAAPSMAIDISDLGKVAVEIAKGKYGEDEVFSNAQMRGLLKTRKAEGEL